MANASRLRAGELPDYTYEDAVIDWASAQFGGVKDSVQKRYQVSLRQLERKFAPDMRMADIVRRDIGDFVQLRIKDGATHATIRRDLTALSRLMSHAVSMGKIDHNPARDWDRSAIKERREHIERPDDYSVNACLRASAFPWPELLGFLLANGSRLEETASIQWPQVDLARGQASFLKTKSGRPRTVTLGSEALAILQAMPRANATDYVFWNPRDGMATRQGTRHGPRLTNISRDFQEVEKKAARLAASEGRVFKRFRLHDLRHEYAIRWVEAGKSIYRLQKHLGHSSVKTTEIYTAYVTPDRAAAAMGLTKDEGQ